MFKSIADLLDYRARSQPDRLALVNEQSQQSWSYAELNARAERAATELRALGLRAQDRFAVLDFNTPPVIARIHGAARMGAVPVLLNWRLPPEEIDFILEDAGCGLLFFGAEFREVVSRLQFTGKKIGPEADSAAAPKNSNSPPAASAPMDLESDFIQLYTSGTTGRPKGVRITHQNMIALCRQLFLEVPEFGGTSRNLVCAPFFHIAGVGWWMFGIYGGATNFPLPRFEPALVARTIPGQAISHGLLVPAMQQAVIAEVDRASAAGEPPYDFSSLRQLLYGASPISEPLLRRSAAVFQCGFTQAYGLSETTGVATLLNHEDHARALRPDAPEEIRARIRGAGKAAAGIEISIRDDKGLELQAGRAGEVYIRGVTVMPGYWNRPDESGPDAEGWFAAGDVGYVDEEGYLYLLDRLKDLIITKGEKVYPIEVERVLVEHKAVREAACAGIPDDEFGEIVCAFVAPVDEKAPPSLEELQAFARESLAGYRMPRKLVIVAELPRNPSGKVLRRELRAPFWQGLERKIH